MKRLLILLTLGLGLSAGLTAQTSTHYEYPWQVGKMAQPGVQAQRTAGTLHVQIPVSRPAQVYLTVYADAAMQQCIFSGSVQAMPGQTLHIPVKGLTAGPAWAYCTLPGTTQGGIMTSRGPAPKH